MPGRLDAVVGCRVHAGGVRTSEIAAAVHVNTQTLRYYDRRDLLPQPQRTCSGYRADTLDAVQMMRLVKRDRQLGLTLDDIEKLLHLADGGPACCDEAKTMPPTPASPTSPACGMLSPGWSTTVISPAPSGTARSRTTSKPRPPHHHPPTTNQE